nr:putative late blight resistance protein homolog R1B-16 [Ipomoea batatas]GME12325.1 putative late blight resistance protein homolog R1B-16 [Ipomoea batatas]
MPKLWHNLDIRVMGWFAGQRGCAKCLGGIGKTKYKLFKIRKMPNISNPDNDIVVGFKKEEEIIIDRLIHGSKEREVVLISGMGGLGKTTLAKRVYEQKIVVNYFDKCAWCTVYQEYDCKDLLCKIYNQVCGKETEIDSVGEELRKKLMGMR